MHPHPTLSETVACAAEAVEGTLTDLYSRGSSARDEEAEMQEGNSLAAGMPRWMAAHPHLAPGCWPGATRTVTDAGELLFAVVLVVIGIGVVAILPPTGPILGWLGRNLGIHFPDRHDPLHAGRPRAAGSVPRSPRQRPGWQPFPSRTECGCG